MGSPALVCLVHGETALDCVGEFGLACRVKWLGVVGVTGRVTVIVAAALQTTNMAKYTAGHVSLA